MTNALWHSKEAEWIMSKLKRLKLRRIRKVWNLSDTINPNKNLGRRGQNVSPSAPNCEILPERADLGRAEDIMPYSSTGKFLVLGPTSVLLELKDMGRPMRLAPSDELLLSLEGPRADIDNGLPEGMGGGPMDPRTVLDERWLRERGPSLESVDDPRLARALAEKRGTLVLFNAFKLRVSIGGGLKSGEPDRDVGVGIDVLPRLLVKERLGMGPRLLAIGDSSLDILGDLTGKEVGGRLSLRIGVVFLPCGDSSITKTQPGLSGSIFFLEPIAGE
jgi:hypothetical protein